MKKSPVVLVERMERKPQQPALATAADPISQIEKRRRTDGALFDDSDQAALFYDKQTIRLVSSVRELNRRVETGSDDGIDSDPGLCLWRRGVYAENTGRQPHRDLTGGSFGDGKKV